MDTSRLGFGGGHIGDPTMREREVAALLNEAVDLGIRIFDTAPSYGLSEARIGRHLAMRRQEIRLVTKLGYGVPGIEDWTPRCLEAGIDRALTILGTDRLDVALLHSCSKERVEDEGLREVLRTAIARGKILAAGYSGEGDALEAAIALEPYSVLMASLNLCDQGILERALPEIRERGKQFLAKRPLANAPWRFAERPLGHYGEVYWERLRAMGLAPGPLDWDELALRFAAFQPGVTAIVAGTSQRERLRRNVALVARGPLPAEVDQKVRESFARAQVDWVGQV